MSHRWAMMGYKLKFHPAALKEWRKTGETVKQ